MSNNKKNIVNTNNKMKIIEKVTNKYLGKSLEFISKDNDIDVGFIGFDKINKELKEIQDSDFGAIFFDGKNNKFMIVINENSSKEEKWFTYGHLLGQYFLFKEIFKHGDMFIINSETIYNNMHIYKNYDEQYYFSNMFAFELLSNKKVVIKTKVKDLSFDECCDFFTFNQIMMGYRLYQLGL